jgi:CBS domain-containing protein
MTVASVMTAPARSCGPNDSLHTAAEIMWEGDCGCVPVVDEQERLVGIVTDRDICMAAHIRGKPLREFTVDTIMATPVRTCHPEDGIDRAAALMTEHQLRRLPVVDPDGRVVGIVSLNDLARAATQRGAHNGVSAEQVTATLAAIGHHRPSPGSAEPR